MEETRQNKMIFSTNEMLYLVGSLGLPYSLLLGDPFRAYSREALKSEIEKGRQALEDSGVIKKVGYQDWELDARITSLFEVVASSAYSFLITSITKPATIEQYAYFYKDQQGISFTLEGHLYQVGIYHDEKTLMNFLLPILGINQQLSQGFPEFLFPGENFAANLLAAWKNLADAVEILKLTGMGTRQAEITAGVLAQAQNANILILHPKPGSTVKKRIAYLVTSRPSLWWSEVIEDQPEWLVFKPLVYSPAALTRGLEDDELTISYDPYRPNATDFVLTFVRGKPGGLI